MDARSHIAEWNASCDRADTGRPALLDYLIRKGRTDLAAVATRTLVDPPVGTPGSGPNVLVGAGRDAGDDTPRSFSALSLAATPPSQT